MGPDDKRNHPESSYSPLKYELGSNMEKTIDRDLQATMLLFLILI